MCLLAHVIILNQVTWQRLFWYNNTRTAYTYTDTPVSPACVYEDICIFKRLLGHERPDIRARLTIAHASPPTAGRPERVLFLRKHTHTRTHTFTGLLLSHIIILHKRRRKRSPLWRYSQNSLIRPVILTCRPRGLSDIILSVYITSGCDRHSLGSRSIEYYIGAVSLHLYKFFFNSAVIIDIDIAKTEKKMFSLLSQFTIYYTILFLVWLKTILLHA